MNGHAISAEYGDVIHITIVIHQGVAIIRAISIPLMHKHPGTTLLLH
jgi:hypothetical protein